jgi:hypothetical protein
VLQNQLTVGEGLSAATESAKHWGRCGNSGVSLKPLFMASPMEHGHLLSAAILKKGFGAAALN